jgi:tetratricopeptide (TPR) repeat protein
VLALAALALGGCRGNFRMPTPQRPAEPSVQIARAKQLAAAAQRAADSGLRTKADGTVEVRDPKKIDEAISLYRQAIEAYREFPAAWLNLGVLYMKQSRNMEAVDAFKIAADLSPADPAPVYNIGVVYEKLDWTRDAQQYYTDALAREPNYQPALQRSIYVDLILDTPSEKTLERLKRAMMLETDPAWIAWFEKQKSRLENRLRVTTGPGPAAG